MRESAAGLSKLKNTRQLQNDEKDINTQHGGKSALNVSASALSLCGHDMQFPPPAQYARIDTTSIILPVCFKQ